MYTAANPPVFEQILHTARQRGLNQAALAAHCGVSVENLSRIKKRGNVQLATLERLAAAAGGKVRFVSDTPASIAQPANANTFRERHAKLIWSNPAADDTALLRAALLRPSFHTLLDAALEFGLPRLQTIWAALLATDPDAQRIHTVTQRILRNIEYGYQQAKQQAQA